MGDYAYTLLLAWPYPGADKLPERVSDLLAGDGLMPDDEQPRPEAGSASRSRAANAT